MIYSLTAILRLKSRKKENENILIFPNKLCKALQTHKILWVWSYSPWSIRYIISNYGSLNSNSLNIKILSTGFLKVRLLEQGLPVCQFSLYLCISLCKIISLIGRKLATLPGVVLCSQSSRSSWSQRRQLICAAGKQDK